MSWDDERVREHVRRLEGLLERLDPAAGEAVQALAELYGEALERVVRLSADASALTGDELIAHLLLMHGLHPETPETRVRRALAALDGFLGRHRTSVEFAGIDGPALRLKVATEGRAAAPRPVLDAVEQAALAAAPELERVDIEAPAPEPVLITLDQLRSRV
ncbi:hypothetical protein E1293_14990 [Actinomadura darangshiensis]|uniref:Nitrogen fixation protein NifU n=1 Tax=Actinomadura darangshiensis TaxID=705336 RepID=A0A4R5BER7_9ACTN|nr:hypothetical protein [Actinomadura darangshiensis]TDD83330.1 hypothetical protein E1293_14990 [Actinomadura darangshiensis]